MLAHNKCKLKVFHFLRCRRTLRDDLWLAPENGIVATLHEDTACNGAECECRRFWIRHPPRDENAHVRLGRENFESGRVRRGHNNDFEKCFDEFFSGCRVKLAIQCDDAAKCRNRIARHGS